MLLLVLAALMLAIRGAWDWSQLFTVAWYGVFGSAVILAIVAIAAAVGGRRLSAEQRALIILVALPALIALPVLIAAVLTHSPFAN